MLPDYPKLKEKLRELFYERLRYEEKKKLGVFAQIPITRIFEGNRDQIIRENGEVEETMIKQMAAEFSINLTEIENLTPEEILKKIDHISEELSKQRVQMVLEAVEEGTKKVGNYYNHKGKPYTAESFLMTLNNLWIDFDENNNPILPPITAGKEAYEIINNVLKSAFKDPEFVSKYSAIIQQKREEFRARESNRKLVD
jgi:hypothetical protein